MGNGPSLGLGVGTRAFYIWRSLFLSLSSLLLKMWSLIPALPACEKSHEKMNTEASGLVSSTVSVLVLCLHCTAAAPDGIINDDNVPDI